MRASYQKVYSWVALLWFDIDSEAFLRLHEVSSNHRLTRIEPELRIIISIVRSQSKNEPFSKTDSAKCYRNQND